MKAFIKVPPDIHYSTGVLKYANIHAYIDDAFYIFYIRDQDRVKRFSYLIIPNTHEHVVFRRLYESVY